MGLEMPFREDRALAFGRYTLPALMSEKKGKSLVLTRSELAKVLDVKNLWDQSIDVISKDAVGPQSKSLRLVEWEDEYLRDVESSLREKLSEGGFDVAYRGCAPDRNSLRLFTADFVVSNLHKFPAAQIIEKKKKFGFSVRKKS